MNITSNKSSMFLAKLRGNKLFFLSFSSCIFYQLIISITLSLASATAQATSVITNTATASFTINGNHLNLSDSVQFTRDTVVTPTDTLTLTKTASVSAALIGETISYTLVVSNPNPRPLSNVTLSDSFPAGLIYQANSATINSVTVNSSNISILNNDLNISLGTIAANTVVTITYIASVSSSTPEGNAINKAIVNSDTASSAQVQANVVISKPIIITPLVLTKNVNLQTVNIDDVARYTLTIQNNNVIAITNAVLNDLLPNGLDYITGSARLDGTVISANASTDISFNLGNLATNTTSTLIYDARVVSLTSNTRSLVNSANVIADDTRANSNTATASVTLVDDSLSITKTTTATNVSAGDVIDYTITLSNPLARALSNLIIKDVLPTGFVYQAGSAAVNNALLSSSDISINANTVDFSIGSLAASASIVLSYQVTVTESALPRENVNTAQAVSDFAASLATTAKVNVRTPSTINFYKISNAGVNSIIQATSYNTDQQGGENFVPINNIPLLDGTFISLPIQQPIIEASQYSVAEPIVIEVIDLDQNLDATALDTIEVTINIPGTNDTEILLLTETSVNSGIFRGIILTTTDTTTVQNGTLTVANGVNINVNYRDDEDNTDISVTAALIVPDTSLRIEKTADKATSSVGELVRYTLELRNTAGFNLANFQLTDVLPLGFRYIPNTLELNGVRLNDNINFDGRTLTVNMGIMPATSAWRIEYVTKISAGVQLGDAVNTAYVSSGALRSNDAQATVKIQDDLMRSRNLLTGRVYIGCETSSAKDQAKPKVLKGARIYMETGRSVITDEDGFWHMEGVHPGAHVLQLDTKSILGYEPLLCDDNTRRAREAKSYFVDLQAGNLWHVDFHVKPIKGYTASETSKSKDSSKDNMALNPLERFGDKYLATANEDFVILWPKNNFVPAVASTTIFIKHPLKQKVELFLNGEKVSPLNYDGSDTNKKRSVTIKRWLGVDIDIKKKNNTLLAILKDKSGKEIARKTRNIHFSSKPASAKFLPDQSILVADGKTTPIIAIQVSDEDGFPMRANTNGYFTIENKQYQAKTKDTKDAKAKDLLNLASNSYKYEIEENGIARIALNPTTQSGQVKLKLQFDDSQSKRSNTEISAWLKPALREWIMVGIAEGTLAHRKLSGNMRTLRDLGKADAFTQRGRVAFFAKGQVKGSYLLTLAYDTHKKDREIGEQLNGDINPDAYYTIYGDSSISQYEAPSSEKLYLKIEKNNFYALFGDYQTDMTVTELAKYQRTLNGIKTEYRGERLSFKSFISETNNNHHHEEIPGDGTSGLYQLANDIIPNSETIVIETRDRFHSDQILVTRELRRYQDYNIDYDDGTLFFKFPITSRDRGLNPNIIVLDYDSEESTNKAITAGGRVAVKSKNGKFETGLSLIQEGQNNTRNNRLVASDLTYKITPSTEVRVEVAQSKTAASSYQKRNAYILELEKEIVDMEARLYFKKQENDFGINSQASEVGTEKIGAELDYTIRENTRINSEISSEENLTNNNKRRLAQIEVEQRFNQYQVNLGYRRHIQENLEPTTNTSKKTNSNIVLLGGQYTTNNNKVTLRSNLEKNISSKTNSELSPDKLIVGVDVKVTQDFNVFAEHELTDNGSLKTSNNRVGLSKDLWKGAKARSTYTQENSSLGQRDYATLGASQRVKLTDKINADFAIDQAITIGSTQSQQRFNENEPVRQGAERDDYTAFSVGLGSSDEDWSWNTRTEYRNGDINDKINFLASVIRHYENGKNLSANLSYYNSNGENNDFDRSTTLSFGSAWHPTEKDFVFFSRLDLISDETSVSSSDEINGSIDSNTSNTQKIVHNMHYNRKIYKKTRVGLHHGIKYVKDQNNAVESSSTVDTSTISLRRDLTKRWDIGVHSGYLHDWDENTIDYVAGASVGMNPSDNIWVELGYNLEGFNDEDFDNNNYTSKGSYINFRYKFNQDTIKNNSFIYRNNQNQAEAEQDQTNKN